VEIRRNLIVYNTASEGGGIGITGGHPIIENNTLWGNSAPEGGCIYQEESGLPDPGTTMIRRNILGGSPVGGAVFCVTDFAMSLDCNCIWNNAGSEIKLSTFYDRGRGVVTLEVVDNGSGLAPEIRTKIFEPYFSTKENGTGLGLTIVSQIIEDHRGYIRALPNEPRGTRFSIEFPASEVAKRAVHS
jgi:hypothetical protein